MKVLRIVTCGEPLGESLRKYIDTFEMLAEVSNDLQETVQSEVLQKMGDILREKAWIMCSSM